MALLDGGRRRIRRARTAEFHAAWRRAIRARLEAASPNAAHCVPLSGGLDSRAVLAGLREELEADEIVAATYGLPDHGETTVARRVAAIAGVRHEVFDVESMAWSQDDVLAYLRNGGVLTGALGAGFLGWRLHQQLGPELVRWSGYMGDATTGGHRPARASRSWDAAIGQFVAWNTMVSPEILPLGFSARKLLPTSPAMPGSALSFDDQLDLLYRQQCRIRHGVMYRGFEFHAPFTESAWLRFALSLPARGRAGQKTYRRALSRIYPRYFPLEAPDGPGGRTPRYRQELRRPDGLGGLVESNLRDLADRQLFPHIDIDRMWREREARGIVNIRNLLQLASLELKLKATPSDPVRSGSRPGVV